MSGDRNLLKRIDVKVQCLVLSSHSEFFSAGHCVMVFLTVDWSEVSVTETALFYM